MLFHHRITKLAFVASAILGGLRPAAARADDPAPVRALLADPTMLATWLRDRDPLIDSSWARAAAASALAQQARVLPNPQLSLGWGGIALGRGNLQAGMTGPTGLGQVSNVTIGASELLELGKRGPRANAADVRTREAGESAVGTLGDRITAATAALARLVYVSARRDTVLANLDAARKLRDLEKVRLDNKDLSAAEFARIELDTEELELQLGRAEADLAGAVATCSATVYAPCSSAGLDPAALDGAAPLPSTLPEPASAIEGRPIRQVAKLEAQALGWDATLASHRAIPDLTLGVGYTYDNYEYSGSIPQTLTFSIGIPIPLFDRGDHDAAAARSVAHAIEAEDQAAVREAHGIVETLLAERTTLQTTVAKLETSAVPKSMQIIAQTRKAFDLGEARLADLLLVERAHRDLLLQVLDTHFDLFNARAQLRQSLGLDDQVARSVGRRFP